MSAVFDLKSIDVVAAAEKGYWHKVYQMEPDGKPILQEVKNEAGEVVDYEVALTGMEVHVVGVGGRVGKQAKAAFDLTIENERKAKDLKEGEKLDVEFVEAALVELLASLTTDWKGFKVYGKKVEFSKEAAKDLYTKFPLIANQIWVAISNVKEMLGNL